MAWYKISWSNSFCSIWNINDSSKNIYLLNLNFHTNSNPESWNSDISLIEDDIHLILDSPRQHLRFFFQNSCHEPNISIQGVTKKKWIRHLQFMMQHKIIKSVSKSFLCYTHYLIRHKYNILFIKFAKTMFVLLWLWFRVIILFTPFIWYNSNTSKKLAQSNTTFLIG